MTRATSAAMPGATPAAAVRAIVEELVASGVRDVVVCPGSRSTPLALAVTGDVELRTWTNLDERSAGFFAVGLARAARRPVAVVVTSGTAAANLHPAAVEAFEGRVPIVLLTADRPPELIGRGAPQTTDQDHLFGRHAKWFAQVPVPNDDPTQIAHVRGLVGRAVATALEAPAGPVHLNLPFREPLIPSGPLVVDDRGEFPAAASSPWVRLVLPERRLSVAGLSEIATRLQDARRGLIVCGPLDREGFASATATLADAAGLPILADGLASVRTGPHDRSHVISRFETILRSERFRDGRTPDLIVRFGAAPTSKALLGWLTELEVEQIVVDDMGWTEPTLRRITLVHADPLLLASDLAGALSARPEAGWLDSWLTADRAADGALERWLAGLTEPFEGDVFAQVGRSAPAGMILYVGSSMPVRDLDAYLPGSDRAIRCLGNRGANGIDGVVSAALGAAAAGAGPVVLVVGDVSFLHDLNALVAARLNGIDATIVIVNNNGGGIFSFLPQATAQRPEVGLPEHYERLFGTPHGIELAPIVTSLGAEHQFVGRDDLAPMIRRSIGRQGVRVLELRTERKRNAELHRAAVASAVAEVERTLDSAERMPDAGERTPDAMKARP